MKAGMLSSPIAAVRPGYWIHTCYRQRAAAAAMEDAEEIVLNYHQATKHSFNRYARGPHGLDWANQPNPFRRYKGSHLVAMDHVTPSADDPDYSDVFGCINSKPLTKKTLSQILYDSLALSAWKSAGGSTWSLRVNPSSGNLHPTEGYVICGGIDEVCDSPFVAHYAPKEHGLEIRAKIPLETWNELRIGFPENSFFIGFSSIFWREAWKYGERAFRYCNHDVGHAIGAVAIASATVGWKSMLLDGWSTDELKLLLGSTEHDSEESDNSGGVKKGCFPELEQEHSDCLMVLFPHGSNVSAKSRPSEKLVDLLSNLVWKGKANSLSREHVWWDIIYRAAKASNKPRSDVSDLQPWETGNENHETNFQGDDALYKQSTVREIVRTRRSAVSMDGKYAIQKEAFYQILLKAMPSLRNPGAQEQLPFSAIPWLAEVNAVLFVHRVVGITQGIYFLIRNPLHEESLKESMKQDFTWQKPPGCPVELPLYLLRAGECRTLAERVSCHQDIASDGCFSLGMVTRFEESIKEHGGGWMYPRLFWEAGLLGQLLYLEAHALGISATGIGCYFDDAVHELLGIKTKKFQSLYHFTIGVPVVDKRIMNLPAYPGPNSIK